MLEYKLQKKKKTFKLITIALKLCIIILVIHRKFANFLGQQAINNRSIQYK